MDFTPRNSEQSARVKTQKELMKALKEMKIRLPSEKCSKGKSGTLATLQYALSCVKQVQASQHYYQQWSIDDSQICSLDMSTYTIEELENITSEYTLKNPDTFMVAVSFTTGKILYISNQVAFILCCKREVFKGVKFAEFLAPQDVSIFYGSTAPYHLPSWGACPSATAAMDYTQEKSVFCRISGGHARGWELRYYPFRLTPYLTKVRDSDSSEGHPCCLIIAERIHSGYEAPRIPPNKQIFTTRHTPSCLFQDVDERAAPLLGYLPQDLVGSPVLFYLHPEDRPLMLAIHKKILQYAGQPFDHSPIRFCARNGEYITIDTSWSSFVNPWSRKVSFIMGRHKVRMGPLNEDVFTAPKVLKSKVLEVDIQELSEQIHRLLLQPVHSSGALGHCSNSASHKQFLSITSSSNSNGFPPEEAQALWPMTFQEICKDVHMVRNQGQQVFIESWVKPLPIKPSRTALDPPISHTGQSRETLRDVEKRSGKAATSEDSIRKEPSNYSYQQINCLDGIIRYLESYNISSWVKRKCGSSSYTTSSNSDDDKQKVHQQVATQSKNVPEERLPATERQPNREETGAAVAATAMVGSPLTPLALPTSKAESVVSVNSQCSFSSTIVHVGDKKPPESDIIMMEETAPSVNPDREPQYRRVGLTKEVLSIHTQKEEHSFLTRFKDLSQLHIINSPSRLNWLEQHHPQAQDQRGSRGLRQGPRGPNGQGHSWKSKAKRISQNKLSDSTSSPQNSLGSPPQLPCPPAAASWAPFGPFLPTLPNMSYPTIMPTYPIPVFPPCPTALPATEPLHNPLPVPQFSPPLVAPMVAVVLPNYIFPQISNPLPQTYFPRSPVFPFGPPLLGGSMLAPGPEAGLQVPSRSSTPHSSQTEQAESPLFESRCSSPLQLNLLQMEELPKPSERQEAVLSSQAAPAGTSADWFGVTGGQGLGNELGPLKEACMVEAHDSSNNDALSSSSDLLDLLLQEDSRSGRGSAASGSMGSGSNGESTSASGTTSSKSSNTSKYFGSVDSSENDLRAKKRSKAEDNEHFMKYVLQDPIWLLMANTDDKVMMTYQLPTR
ncbi:period circadian protein homolog 1-like [Notechis scutatus]|uniref:Period circadian protein homolog 1-like n=1 Tax=Notechis scutatus TaxID=8663 RepID=A0A6J1W007_9SAUR|nr:period circadian protein homolog 1-like [Notechis scutatus]